MGDIFLIGYKQLTPYFTLLGGKYSRDADLWCFPSYAESHIDSILFAWNNNKRFFRPEYYMDFLKSINYPYI